MTPNWRRSCGRCACTARVPTSTTTHASAFNGRLDTLRAAILIEKLAIFAEEIVHRNEIAARYDAALADVAKTPVVLPDCTSTWGEYTIRVSADARDALRGALSAHKILTAIYYPLPLHQRTAYRHYPVAGNGLLVSDMLGRS